MNSEFPDLDDEFDLLHEDEYEVLRELEAIETQATITNDTSNSKKQQTQSDETQQDINNKETIVESLVENSNEESQTIAVIENETSESSKSTETTKKRPISQISQNFSAEILDQILFDDIDEAQLHEEKRPCWDRPEELMQLILDRRKKVYTNGLKNNSKISIIEKTQTNSISKRVPLWNFVAVTRTEDGERFYIKVSNKNEYVPQSHGTTSNCLIKSFDQLKHEAEQIIIKSVEKASLASIEPTNREPSDCTLWVDKYRPKRYIDLLSEENVNRSLLYWLKLWDKIVFNKDFTVRAKKPQIFSKFKNKFKNKLEDIPDYDSKGFPTKRIVLLSGSPGLGKTTLAHVAARHVGYNIVELNASDDRGPEAFREALLASTQMKALIDKEKRPNCLVLDEIDGAPTASIELLLKFIHGKLIPKGRHKIQQENDGCRRPIICICNDLYTPSLRSLRNMALVINVPEISPSTLADRLSEIAYKEGLNIDSRILLQLAEKSGCDIRACLGILQYTGGGANMLQNLAFGLKDMRKGLFESWKELLQVPYSRRGILNGYERAQKVMKVVQQNEPERLAHGIFHNYPLICKDNIIPVYKALQWFEFYDEVNTLVVERQNWMLMPYTMSAFVAWHLHLAGSQNPKISFPTILFEVNQKLERNQAILSVTKKVSKIDMLTLLSEILPYLPDLLSPRLRSVNAQLYSAKEKEELNRLVNLMLDFGLTFTQEKKPDGGYDYYLDPNIWNIGTFPDCKIRKPLTYAVKQIVIQELESTRLQRATIMTEKKVENSGNSAAPPTTTIKNVPLLKTSHLDLKTDENVPNHLKQLNPIQLKPSAEKKCRNFFLSFQLAGQEKLRQKQIKEQEKDVTNGENSLNNQQKLNTEKKNDLFKSDVWYQFKEGYSNAIRRTVLMEDLI